MGEERAISGAEFAGWVTPREAVARLSHLGGITAKDEIMARLQTGLLRAIAKNAFTPQEETEYQSISPLAWRGRTLNGTGSSFWHTGTIELQVQGFDFRFFGVRFDPMAFMEMLPAETPAPQPASIGPASLPIPASRVGRPPKEWWEDLWIEMCRQIYIGDLQPKTQADIERAMLNWAASKEYEMGEATAKRAARKLFPIFRDEGSK